MDRFAKVTIIENRLQIPTMPENTAQQEPTAQASATEPEFTLISSRAEPDRIIEQRLTRERRKYAGYVEYKAETAELDALKEAGKTELECATEYATKAECSGELTSEEAFEKWSHPAENRFARTSQGGIDFLRAHTPQKTESCRGVCARFDAWRDFGIGVDGAGEGALRGEISALVWLVHGECTENSVYAAKYRLWCGSGLLPSHTKADISPGRAPSAYIRNSRATPKPIFHRGDSPRFWENTLTHKTTKPQVDQRFAHHFAPLKIAPSGILLDRILSVKNSPRSMVNEEMGD